MRVVTRLCVLSDDGREPSPAILLRCVQYRRFLAKLRLLVSYQTLAHSADHSDCAPVVPTGAYSLQQGDSRLGQNARVRETAQQPLLTRIT